MSSIAVATSVAAHDRASAADELRRSQAGDAIERRRRPVRRVRVAHVGCGPRLDEVAREADPLVGQPDDEVTGGVPAAEVAELDRAVAEVDRHRVVERVGRPRQARDGLGAGEEARHAALLAGPVGHAPLFDEGGGGRVGDDPPRAEALAPSVRTAW